jgi:hypothetical protein
MKTVAADGETCGARFSIPSPRASRSGACASDRPHYRSHWSHYSHRISAIRQKF